MERPRIVLIGLDGATFDLIQPWVQEGKLPAFQKLMREGVWGPLETTVPPITPCAWSSFMTGKNPGKHGQFSFYKFNDSFNLSVDWDEYRTEEAVWEILSQEGKRCCVVNVPLTYPPHKVNGYMVSGFTAPGLGSEFTYPRELKAELLQVIPEFRIAEENRYTERKEDMRAFARDIMELTEIHERTASYLMGKEEWDFFMVTFMATDHIQHWYWKYMDSSHPDHEPDEEFKNKILEVYLQVDGVIQRIMQQITPDVTLMVMSDHGFGQYIRDVNINKWLRENGHLKFKRTASVLGKGILYSLGITPAKIIKMAMKMGLGRFSRPSPGNAMGLAGGILEKVGYTWRDIDWERTVAYSFGYYGSIYINRKAFPGQEGIESAEYEKLRDKLISQLSILTMPGSEQRLVDDIWKREDIYWGEKKEKLPDISFSMGGYAYAAAAMLAFPSGEMFSSPKTLKSGDHRSNGIFMAYGNKIRQGCRIDKARIIDLAPTILNLMNMEVPPDMDGRVLNEVLE